MINTPQNSKALTNGVYLKVNALHKVIKLKPAKASPDGANLRNRDWGLPINKENIEGHIRKSVKIFCAQGTKKFGVPSAPRNYHIYPYFYFSLHFKVTILDS